jgi:hypothetical protein
VSGAGTSPAKESKAANNGGRALKLLVDVVRVRIRLPHRVAIHHIDIRVLARTDRKMPRLTRAIRQIGQHQRSPRAQVLIRTVFRALIEHLKGKYAR